MGIFYTMKRDGALWLATDSPCTSLVRVGKRNPSQNPLPPPHTHHLMKKLLGPTMHK